VVFHGACVQVELDGLVASQRHGDVEVSEEGLDDVTDTTFTTVSETVDVWASNQDGIGTEGEGLEDVGAGADTRVEEDGQATLDGLDDLGEGIERSDRAIDLLTTVVGDNDTVAAVFECLEGIGSGKDTLQDDGAAACDMTPLPNEPSKLLPDVRATVVDVTINPGGVVGPVALAILLLEGSVGSADLVGVTFVVVVLSVVNALGLPAGLPSIDGEQEDIVAGAPGAVEEGEGDLVVVTHVELEEARGTGSARGRSRSTPDGVELVLDGTSEIVGGSNGLNRGRGGGGEDVRETEFTRDLGDGDLSTLAIVDLVKTDGGEEDGCRKVVAEEVDGQITAASIKEDLGDNAPVVESLPVGTVGPADTSGSGDVAPWAGTKTLLGREFKLLGMDGETGLLSSSTLEEDLSLVESIDGGWGLASVLGVHFGS